MRRNSQFPIFLLGLVLRFVIAETLPAPCLNYNEETTLYDKGKCYYLKKTEMNFEDAKSACEEMDAHLAEPLSETERTLLNTWLKSQVSRVWLGGQSSAYELAGDSSGLQWLVNQNTEFPSCLTLPSFSEEAFTARTSQGLEMVTSTQCQPTLHLAQVDENKNFVCQAEDELRDQVYIHPLHLPSLGRIHLEVTCLRSGLEVVLEVSVYEDGASVFEEFQSVDLNRPVFIDYVDLPKEHMESSLVSKMTSSAPVTVVIYRVNEDTTDGTLLLPLLPYSPDVPLWTWVIAPLTDAVTKGETTITLTWTSQTTNEQTSINREVEYMQPSTAVSFTPNSILECESIKIRTNKQLSVFVISNEETPPSITVPRISTRLPNNLLIKQTAFALPVIPKGGSQSSLAITTIEKEATESVYFSIGDERIAKGTAASDLCITGEFQVTDRSFYHLEGSESIQVSQEFKFSDDAMRSCRLDIFPQSSWMSGYAFTWNHMRQFNVEQVFLYAIYTLNQPYTVLLNVHDLEESQTYCQDTISGFSGRACLYEITDILRSESMIFRLRPQDNSIDEPFGAFLVVILNNTMVCRQLAFNDEPRVWGWEEPSDEGTTNNEDRTSYDATATTVPPTPTSTESNGNKDTTSPATEDEATEGTNANTTPNDDTVTALSTSAATTASSQVTWTDCWDIFSLEKCRCQCTCLRTPDPQLCRPPPTLPPIETAEEKEEIVDAIKTELTIDAQKTSAAVRKKTSAKDERASSTSIGYVGVAMLTVVLALVILPDMINVSYFLFHTLAPKYSTTVGRSNSVMSGRLCDFEAEGHKETGR